jgi:2-polyprenyl-6-methoxyphenol hydroxylase-like FAD-dependent oxidoreductase
VTYVKDGTEHRIDCDFVAGCDGFHGASRQAIPKAVLREYERVYPFGWLGVLSRTPPAAAELIYANHERGFALCSMRNESLSRYYIQAPVDDPLDRWTDAAFWDELRRRIPAEGGREPRHRAPRSRSRSRPCAPSWPSRCAGDGSSSSATPPISCRPRAPRG